MKSRNLLVITALGLGMALLGAFTADDSTTEATVEARTFEVDPVHSATLFRVQHLGAGMFYGRFNDVTGTIEFDPDAKRGLKLDIDVAIDSVDCGHPGLDGHLKSPDFFNAVEFPKMMFRTTSAKPAPAKQHEDGDVYDVEGDLTIHGVTRKITVEAIVVGHSKGQRGEKLGIECIFSIKRSDYDMSYGVESGGIGDRTGIIVSLEATAR